MRILVILTFCSFSFSQVDKPEVKSIVIDDLINIAETAFDGVSKGIGYVAEGIADFFQSDYEFVESTGM